MKQFCRTLLHGRGPYFDYIADQKRRYEAFKDQQERNDKAIPLAEGVLILDEVKVVGKIAWNSKTGKMSGIVMEEGEYGSLVDIYADMRAGDDIPRPAEYFLQFLWRDLTSNFDIIGPHYSSDRTMDYAFTHTCLTDALVAFQTSGFKVSSLCV